MSKVTKLGFEMLPIAALVSSEENPRFELPELQELMQSMEAHGIIAPIVVEPEGEKFKVLDGHRRAQAAAELGLKEVPCVIRAAGSNQAVIALIASGQSIHLTPLENAIAVQRALSGRKLKQKDLGRQIGKSETWVSKFVTIAKAYGKIPEDALGTINAWKETGDADKLYKMARKALGLDKEETQDELPIAEGEGEGGEGSAGEIEVIRELEQLAAAKLGVPTKDISITPAGKAGFKLEVLFKSEAGARYALELDGE